MEMAHQSTAIRFKSFLRPRILALALKLKVGASKYHTLYFFSTRLASTLLNRSAHLPLVASSIQTPTSDARLLLFILYREQQAGPLLSLLQVGNSTY